jgi:hypothetical protein
MNLLAHDVNHLLHGIYYFLRWDNTKKKKKKKTKKKKKIKKKKKKKEKLKETK